MKRLFLFLFILMIPSISHSGNICFDQNGYFCTHFFNLDKEWLTMIHTDSFTDNKKIISLKFENGTQRLWEKYGKASLFGANRVHLNLECSNGENGEVIQNLNWTKDVFESPLGKRLNMLAFLYNASSGSFGGPRHARNMQKAENALKEMKETRINVAYRFDSEKLTTSSWEILSTGNMIFSPIPNDIIRKIVKGGYQKLALRGDFLSMKKTAFFDLSQSKPSVEKQISICPSIKYQ